MYCPECGSKIPSDANFCEKCGEKIFDEENIKFCKYCGKKINADAEICPECGIRIVNPLRSNTKKTVNSISDSLLRFLKSKYFKILILAVFVLILAINTPKIIDSITPYKDVGSNYISNPVPFEKVRFSGEYMGETFSASGGLFMIMSSTSYSVVKVDDQYVILRDNNLGIIGNAKVGDTIQLEGRFSKGGKTTQPFNGNSVSGYFFAPESYKIIG